MASSNNDDRSNTADPRNAATDPRGAAIQEQVRADHDALEQSQRRVEASVSADVRNTPVQHQDTGADRGMGTAATDASAAAKQDQVHADHDALQESARRVRASVPADVRNTPVQAPDRNANDANTAHDNAQAARESARRVEQSVEHPEIDPKGR